MISKKIDRYTKTEQEYRSCPLPFGQVATILVHLSPGNALVPAHHRLLLALALALAWLEPTLALPMALHHILLRLALVVTQHRPPRIALALARRADANTCPLALPPVIGRRMKTNAVRTLQTLVRPWCCRRRRRRRSRRILAGLLLVDAGAVWTAADVDGLLIRDAAGAASSGPARLGAGAVAGVSCVLTLVVARVHASPTNIEKFGENNNYNLNVPCHVGSRISLINPF